MKRFVLAALAAAAFVWAATRIFEAERWRSTLRAALQQSLQREVEINGGIEYRWLTSGPGVSIEDVVIHEDPTLGREPVAYVTTLDASPRWLPLLRGKVDFETLTLNEPSVNVMRTDDGRLNIRPFLAGLAAARDSGSALPGIQVRGGRLNFKQGRHKSTIYLTALDLDLRPTESSGFNIGLATEAARTDRPPMGFGSFSGQGRLTLSPEKEPHLDFTLDLDRSPLADVLVLLSGRRVEIGGRISARTRITGPVSKLTLDGRVDLEGFQRWSLPGFKPGALTLYYRGEADLARPATLVETVPGSRAGVPLKVRLRAGEFFSRPRWGLLATADQLPLALMADAARATGFRIPEDASPDGIASGAMGLSSSVAGPRGGFRFEGEDFLGEYRYDETSDRPHRLTLDCAQMESNELKLRAARMRLAGTSDSWEGTVEARAARGGLQVSPTANRIRLSMGDGRQFEGQAWPLDVSAVKEAKR